MQEVIPLGGGGFELLCNKHQSEFKESYSNEFTEVFKMIQKFQFCIHHFASPSFMAVGQNHVLTLFSIHLYFQGA